MGSGACKAGGHPDFVEVDGEVDEDPVFEFEDRFAAASIEFVLAYCVGDILTGELVFEFEGDHWYAVYEEDDIDTVF